ncbi:MAG: hypothetical protein AAB915_01015 [Patescibacteria group bacterium]
MNNLAVQNISEPRPFRGTVLKQIYRVWLWRRFVPVLVAEVAVLSFVLYALARLIFVERVLQNGLAVIFTRPEGIGSFLIRGFLQASAPTQVLTAGTVLVAALLIRHITQGILRFILVKENYFGKAQN